MNTALRSELREFQAHGIDSATDSTESQAILSAVCKEFMNSLREEAYSTSQARLQVHHSHSTVIELRGELEDVLHENEALEVIIYILILLLCIPNTAAFISILHTCIRCTRTLRSIVIPFSFIDVYVALIYLYLIYLQDMISRDRHEHHIHSHELFEEMLQGAQAVLPVQNEFLLLERSSNEEMSYLREELAAANHVHESKEYVHPSALSTNSAPADELVSSVAASSSLLPTSVSDVTRKVLQAHSNSHSSEDGAAEFSSIFSVRCRAKDGYPGFLYIHGTRHLLLSALPSPNFRPPKNTSIIIQPSAAGFTGRRIAALKEDQGGHNMNSLDKVTTDACVSHLNLTTASILGIGGQYHRGQYLEIFRGISLYLLQEDPAHLPYWSFSQVLVDGYHPGSIERRTKCKGVSEFDGQASLVYFKDHFLLYTRANCAESGHRQVQVCMGTTLSKFESFKLCSFSHTCMSDNIYFAHIYVCGGFLLAIVPIAFHVHVGGGIYIYIYINQLMVSISLNVSF